MFQPSAAPRARVADIATYVPDGRLTNADLERIVETSDEWIVQRTGIRERSVAAGDQLATCASKPSAGCARASVHSIASMR
jgi:3-oxoacyl-[acyl-carrier-protein] synthase III